MQNKKNNQNKQQDKEQLASVYQNNVQNTKQSYVEKAEAQPKDYEEIEY